MHLGRTGPGGRLGEGTNPEPMRLRSVLSSLRAAGVDPRYPYLDPVLDVDLWSGKDGCAPAPGRRSHPDTGRITTSGAGAPRRDAPSPR